MPESRIIATKEEAKYYPFTGIYKWARNTFWSAGQDSYTQPPAQDPDMFMKLTNVEPVTQGTLQRRRGYTLFSNAFSGSGNTYRHSYAFRSENLNLRRIVWSSITGVDITDEVGNSVVSSFITPSAGATSPRMVLSRDFGYFSDGVLADYVKWDGTTNPGNKTNWGIDVFNQTTSTTFGPNFVGTGTNINGAGWTNPGNITADDGVFATVVVTNPSSSTITVSTGYLAGETLGFSIPAGAHIKGIKVEVKGFTAKSGGGPINNTNINVSLIRAGAPVGQVKSALLPAFSSYVTFGGASDLWGVTWLPADVNAANFGAGVQAQVSFSAETDTFSVDAIRITVYATGAAITLGAPAAGNITLLSGRTYFYAFLNSKTGHTSGFGPPSASTGPLTNNNQPLSTIPVSADPQVDTTILLATADGNDQTTLFLLANLANGTTTYTDNIPDTVLITQPVYQQTDNFGLLHGIANNNLPPTADFPTKHKGRLYMAQGHSLFFSKSLDDVTTSSGTITGKWEEAWPATNLIDLSEFAETIKAIISDGETLWIGTERNIRRLIGDGPLNFQKPEIQFNECGVLSQEVWKVVFYEGQPVGTMWMTPDFRVMVSDFNTYQDVGTPIQDVLNSINPSALTAAHAVFVSKQAFDLYMLYIPTGSNNIPDTVCIYNLRTKKWSIWQPTDLISTSLFNIDVNGNPQWLFSALNASLYFWDSTTRQDRTNNTPVSYPVTMQTSWLDMGDFTWWKTLNLQIVSSDDTNLTLAIEGALVNSDFTTPMSILSATTVSPSELRSYLQVPLVVVPARHYWFRLTWVSPASTIQNVLTTHSTEVVPYSRF